MKTKSCFACMHWAKPKKAPHTTCASNLDNKPWQQQLATAIATARKQLATVKPNELHFVNLWDYSLSFGKELLSICIRMIQRATASRQRTLQVRSASRTSLQLCATLMQICLASLLFLLLWYLLLLLAWRLFWSCNNLEIFISRTHVTLSRIKIKSTRTIAMQTKFLKRIYECTHSLASRDTRPDYTHSTEHWQARNQVKVYLLWSLVVETETQKQKTQLQLWKK